MASHYEVLGIDRSATPEEVAKAYFRRTSGSRKAGFIRGSSQSRADRQAVEDAYAVLIDRSSRAAYDRTLDAGPP